MQVSHARRYIHKFVVPEVHAGPPPPPPAKASATARAAEPVCKGEQLPCFASPRAVARLPRPSGSTPPILGEAPPERGGSAAWLLVDCVDLSQKLVDDHGFAAFRQYPNSFEFCQQEWPAVETEIFKLLRERGLHDCFWLFQDRTAVPVNNPNKARRGTPSQWNQDWCPCPPVYTTRRGTNKFCETGFEYKCDFRLQTGCPSKLRVMRDWTAPGDTYKVLANDVHPRHGCNHTFACCSLDGNLARATTPSLHAVLKIFIQRFLYDANRAQPWSAMKEKAEEVVRAGMHLHCNKCHMKTNLPPMSPAKMKKVLAQPTCKHTHVMTAFLNGMAPHDGRAAVVRSGFPEREVCPLGAQRPQNYHENLERAPSGDGAIIFYRYVDRYYSIASQLLDGGLCEMHPGNFSVTVNKQAERYCNSKQPAFLPGSVSKRLYFFACRRYVRRWNRILYSQTNLSSNMVTMWEEFQSDNLRGRLDRSILAGKSSLQNPPPLDLWCWSMIGLVRT